MNPPPPLTQVDVWFQVGHAFELKQEFQLAKEAYERVLLQNPNHAKVLQQLGWLFHSNTQLGNHETAIHYLMRSLEADSNDGQTWYLLGRCYMSQQKYRKAYDAYQQAVYRDGRNPMFWCSIGVLYYQINQYRDALDAYSRAIRLNPYLNEVWYGLGALYETCNQPADSLDAYQRALELNEDNKHIQQRLNHLKQQLQSNGGVATNASPHSVHHSSNLLDTKGSPLGSGPLKTAFPPNPASSSPYNQSGDNRTLDKNSTLQSMSQQGQGHTLSSLQAMGMVSSFI